MSDVVICALFSFFGTVLGTFGGIIAGAKLTAFRLEQLERKVEKHNGFGERIPVIEERIDNQEKRIDGHEKRIDTLEHKGGAA